MSNTNQVKIRMTDYFEMPNRDLRSFMGRQIKGDARILTTEFGGDADIQEICDDWLQHLESGLTDWPGLLEFEIGMRDKVGPLSVMQPLKERISSVQSYYSYLDGDRPVDEEVVTQFLKEWSSVRGLRIRTQEKTWEAMKKTTNSGSPYFTKKSSVVESTLPCHITRLGGSDFNVEQPEFKGLLTAILGWRGQEGGPSPENVKQRDLFMFPFAGNVAELQLYQVLIEAAQRRNLVPAWNGDEAVDVSITKLFDSKAKNDLVVCTDFTKFDQHYGESMQNVTLRLLDGLFTNDSQYNEWRTHIYPLKYWIPLLLSYDGDAMIGHHGMGSGSGGTNGDETLGHRYLQHGAAMSKGQKLNLNSMCLGDDGIISYPRIRTQDVVDYYTSYGLEMNEGKQTESSSECVYLKRWHSREYRPNGLCAGVYSTCRAYGKFKYVERPTRGWSDVDFAMRELSIGENCRYHPLGSEWVQHALPYSVTKFGSDIPGFFDHLDQNWVESKNKGVFSDSYTAQFNRPKPPSQWWIVQQVRRLTGK